MVNQRIIPEEVAALFNDLPTTSLQLQAVELFRKRIQATAEQVKKDLLHPAPRTHKPAESGEQEPLPKAQERNLRALASDLLTVLKDEVLDKYAWRWGRPGNVVMDWGNRAWSKGKPKTTFARWMTGLVLAGLLWGFVVNLAAWPFRWLYHHTVQPLSQAAISLTGQIQRRPQDVSVTSGASLPAKENAATAAVGGTAPVFGHRVPAPKITDVFYTTGHRIVLKWEPLGEGYRYEVHYDHDIQDPGFRPVREDQTVRTPGALVDLSYDDGEKALLAVAAINAQGEMGELSEPVKVKLTGANRYRAVEPLPEEFQSAPAPTTAAPAASTRRHLAKASSPLGGEGPPRNNLQLTWAGPVRGGRGRVRGKSSPSPQSSPLKGEEEKRSPAVPVPQNLTMRVISPQRVRLSWTGLGSEYRYNVYSWGMPDRSDLRRETKQPVAIHEGDWTPVTDLDRYWIAVTAVDVQGRESAYSPPVEVALKQPASGEPRPPLTGRAADASGESTTEKVDRTIDSTLDQVDKVLRWVR